MKKVLVFAFIIFVINNMFGQDIHYSQYYAAPISLNPSNTGLINGDFRVAANYRGQWFKVPTAHSLAPYNTYQGSFDASLFRKKLRNSQFGVGALFYADEAGNGSLATYNISGSVAYHQALDRYGRSKLSLGFQAGFVQKRIFENDLYFEQQFDAGLNSFNPLLNNGEDQFNSGHTNYFDLNAGAMFSTAGKKKVGGYLGFAVNHLTRPGESFLDSDNRIGMRYIAHGGMSIKVGSYFKIFPTALYMLQSQAQQANIGSGFEYEFSDNFSGFFGLWTRLSGGVTGIKNDAIIGTIGVETFNTRIGLSYDVNTSGFRGASKSIGAFEVSVIYIHNKQEDNFRSIMFCPQF